MDITKNSAICNRSKQKEKGKKVRKKKASFIGEMKLALLFEYIAQYLLH